MNNKCPRCEQLAYVRHVTARKCLACGYESGQLVTRKEMVALGLAVAEMLKAELPAPVFRERNANTGRYKLELSPEEAFKAWQAHGSQPKAARALGCSLQTLVNRINDYRVTQEREKWALSAP